MKKRIFALCMAFLMAFCIIWGSAADVHGAQSDKKIEQNAQDFVQAVEAGRQEVDFLLKNNDVDGMLDQIFLRYPVLLHYYDGCQWTEYQDRTELTVFLKNTHHALSDVWVVGSDVDLLAVLGLGLAEIRREVYFVTEAHYELTTEKFSEIFELLHHHYYLAYMGYSSWGSSYFHRESIGVQDYTLQFYYHYDLDAQTLQRWRNETEQVALNLASSLFAQDMPDYEKLLRIHNWIIENCRYNMADLSESGNHLAYGALVKGTCVCMGYAEAGVLLFPAAGIQTYYVSGEGTNSTGQTEAHSWNAVQIDGEWYLVDMTWDDPVTSDGSDVLLYDYFLLTDAQLSRDHTWDREGLPACNGSRWNAESALAASAQDTGSYGLYDASLLVTQEEAWEEFHYLLRTGADNLPGNTAAEPIVTQPAEKPDDSKKETKPVKGETPDKPENKPAPTQKKFPWGIVILCVVAVVVIAAVVALILYLREKRIEAERRRRRRSHNITFEDLGRPF